MSRHFSKSKLPADQRARIHASHRAWQRFGIAIGDPELREAEQMIWAGAAEWVQDLAGLRQAYRIKLKSRMILVVFDIHIAAIVTCLPNSPLVRLT